MTGNAKPVLLCHVPTDSRNLCWGTELDWEVMGSEDEATEAELSEALEAGSVTLNVNGSLEEAALRWR